jgi:elongation factor Ts
MEITAQMVSQLREQTGAGMMECKKALLEANGNLDEARDVLRKKGMASAEKRAGRTAADGVVAIAETPTATTMLELNSETDFVARNEEFRALAHEIATAHSSSGAADVAGLLETTLGDGQTVKAKLEEALSRMRENLVLRRAVRYDVGANSVVGSYIHAVDSKTGVLVELSGDPSNEKVAELARGIAMHVAWSKPEYLNSESVPAEIVEKEKALLAELTRNEGKPEAAIAKIVEGRIGKFFERACLVEQPYVRDNSKKIKQLAEELGATVVRFDLFVVGQA